jgi:hypothetical protein
VCQHGRNFGAATGRPHLHDAEVEDVDHVAQCRVEAEGERELLVDEGADQRLGVIDLTDPRGSERNGLAGWPQGTHVEDAADMDVAGEKYQAAAGRGIAVRVTCRERLLQQVLLLAPGGAVRPLVARFVEVGDLEVAEIGLLAGEPRDLRTGKWANTSSMNVHWRKPRIG